MMALQDTVETEFKETEVGLIPVDWDVVELGQICTKVSVGHVGKTTPYYAEEGVPFLRTQNVYPGHVDINSAIRIIPSFHRKLKKSQLRAKDLVITRVGNAGTCGIIPDGFNEINCANILFARPDLSKVNAWYLMYYINEGGTQKLMDASTVGSIQKVYNTNTLNRLRVALPPLPEQRRIAAVLNAIQEAIAAQEDVIAEARAFKRSLMQRLFTYGPGPVPAETKETELGEIPSHWEVVELGELVLDLQNGLYKPSDYYGSGYPILRIDAYEPGDTIDRQLLKRLRLSVDELETYALETGNIIVNRVNGNIELVGKAALIGELTEPTVFESNMIRVRVNPEVMLDRFLLQFLCTPQARDQIRQKARLVHQASINQQDLKSFPVPLPNYDEQRKVASLLADADAKIAAEKDRKAALQDLFKSTLHQLMTGQVRLLDDEGVPL